MRSSRIGAWAGRGLLWVLVAQLVLFTGWLATGGELWHLVLIAPGLISAAVLKLPVFAVEFRSEESPRTPTHVQIAVLFAGAVLLHLMVIEAGDLADELHQRQYQSKCDAGESLRDCREAAKLALPSRDGFR